MIGSLLPGSVRRTVRAGAEFVETEAASGVVLMGAAVVAVAWANLAGDSYTSLWRIPITIGFAPLAFPSLCSSGSTMAHGDLLLCRAPGRACMALELLLGPRRGSANCPVAHRLPSTSRIPCRLVQRGYNSDMLASWLILAVTLYVSIDVANPLMPGALTFGIEDSVEVRQAERFRSHHDVTLLPAAPPCERVGGVDHQTVLGRVPAADIPLTFPSRVSGAPSSLSNPNP